MSQPSDTIKDKNAEEIHVGDTVSTKFRGGKRAGEVEAIVGNDGKVIEGDDVEITIKNPPKVVFTDQHGHQVAHNPGTLSGGENPT